MTRWNFPSALEWEMMSAASVPLAEVIKKRGSEFPQVFFLTFPHSFGIPVEFGRLKLEVRQRILNMWQFPVLFSTLANVPILAAIFPILKLACSGIMHASVIRGGGKFFFGVTCIHMSEELCNSS